MRAGRGRGTSAASWGRAKSAWAASTASGYTCCFSCSASVYRALAEHAKREAYPEAVEQAHADLAALQAGEFPGPRAEPETVR